MVDNSPDHLYTLAECGFSYHGLSVLTGLNLQLQAGKLYGLIGPNGSGKTTLIRLLTGTANPTSGHARLYGRAVRDYRKTALARMLSYVPQSFRLGFDFTVEEVVMMGRHPYIGRFGTPSATDHHLVSEALRALDIVSLRNRYVTRLSGGERQRVLLARALAQNCEVMILDEATANLDVKHSIEIMRALVNRVRLQGNTVITAIHDLDLAAAFCDQLIVLNRGKLHGAGPVAELLSENLLDTVFGVEADILRPATQPPHIQYRYHHV